MREQLIAELEKNLKARQDNPSIATAALQYSLDMPRALEALREEAATNADLRAKFEKAEEWVEKCALKMEELAAGELSSNVFTIDSLHRAAKELRKFAALKGGKHE